MEPPREGAMITAISNQKGGVGKTTLTINLSAALSSLKNRVLVIDLDPQGHLTQGIGFGQMWEDEGYNLYHALIGREKRDFHELILHHEGEGFDLIPSNGQLVLAERAFSNIRHREDRLRHLLAPIQNEYDWILIDCPPDLYSLTDNAVNAARTMIVPVQAEATSLWALRLLLDQVASMMEELHIDIDILAIVPNLVLDSMVSKHVLARLRSEMPHVTPFELRKRVMLQQAWIVGQSIFAYRAGTHAEEKTRMEIVDGYLQLAHYVMARVSKEAVRG